MVLHDIIYLWDLLSGLRIVIPWWMLDAGSSAGWEISIPSSCMICTYLVNNTEKQTMSSRYEFLLVMASTKFDFFSNIKSVSHSWRILFFFFLGNLPGSIEVLNTQVLIPKKYVVVLLHNVRMHEPFCEPPAKFSPTRLLD
jgi:hypothetical protein